MTPIRRLHLWNEWNTTQNVYIIRKPDLDRLISAHPGHAGTTIDSDQQPLLRMRRTKDPPGLRLAGEVDISNRDALAAVLEGLPRDLAPGDQTATVDITQLSFADAGAAHLLLRTAARLSAGLRLVGCTPQFSKILDIVSGGPRPHTFISG